MAVMRRIGNLTIHFPGENAAQLASMFDDAHSRSRTFKRDMDETSRTHKNIYVGSALADLQDQPDIGNAGFNPESRDVKDRPAFGKAAGAETHFIVVKPGSHSLIHDGRRFDGSAQLALVHELLHPSQIIRELADQGGLGKDNERRTQMREQDIAIELGKVPGKDFPDVRGSEAPYNAQQDPEQQPNSGSPNEQLPVAPLRYFGPTRIHPARPSPIEDGSAFEVPRYRSGPLPTGLLNSSIPATAPRSEERPSASDTRPVRYLSSRFFNEPQPSESGDGTTAPPLVPSDENFNPRQAMIGERFAGSTASYPTTASRDSPQPGMPLVGLVSGKPMSFYPVQPPIFRFPEPGARDDEDWLLQLLAPRRGR